MLNAVRNILLSSATALALCAGPTMAVASTAPHFVPASPITELTPVHETVDYTIHHIQTLDPTIRSKGSFRLTHGRGSVGAWTLHQLSTGKSYSTGYRIKVEQSKNGAQTVSFYAVVTDPTFKVQYWKNKPTPPKPPKVPSLLVMRGEKTASLSDGPVTIPCGGDVFVTLSEKG